LNLLLVDTSGKELGIGVFSGDKCLYEHYMAAERAYNRHIIQLIIKATSAAGLKLEKIDLFAAVLGPGSFTGIRVGIAVMKSIAQALGKKFTGLAALDIIANGAGADGRVWAVLEAGRGEVYTAVYKSPGSGVQGPGKKTKYMLLSREEFIKKLKKGDTVAGLRGENIIVELKAKSSKINIAELEHIGMRSFAELIRGIKAPGRDSIYKIEPVYIRPSEAEARRRLKAKTEAKK
jgi:tRNA threonylcarbamoyladenosine biosynthesis protein TsaB